MIGAGGCTAEHELCSASYACRGRCWSSPQLQSTKKRGCRSCTSQECVPWTAKLGQAATKRYCIALIRSGIRIHVLPSIAWISMLSFEIRILASSINCLTRKKITHVFDRIYNPGSSLVLCRLRACRRPRSESFTPTPGPGSRGYAEARMHTKTEVHQRRGAHKIDSLG